ncbi:acyl-[acyl-carrier-protein] thioesterase [Qiania dongpingensis]|uniref:Acyl-[acyl-carrier-protein] thioesterase n=1 Tax=Qiania dongpingensis TaxID=2763669 RepID=A0A7G9G6D0_9FIRM|nr:acyl-ACP thioesterase domain-containing protein [Qiania dongpingensis]QNM06362.1 acyl-[acyl-carrier-protein] thioesterase [Qiania dongpingensis]
MYSFDSKVRYSEVGADGRLSLCSVIHYMQDCSIFQSEMLGVGVRALQERGRAWLLSAWQVELYRRPELGETLKVGTWASGFKAMYGYRNFVIIDAAGDYAVKANSIWVYMNLETGRPEKVDKQLADIYQAEEPLDMETDGRKIKIPDNLMEFPSFPVRRYQIDTNGHVNNGQYIQMAEEWLPGDNDIRKLRVEYKKAAVYGDTVIPMAGGNADSVTVVLKGSEGQVYAVVQAVSGKG